MDSSSLSHTQSWEPCSFVAGPVAEAEHGAALAVHEDLFGSSSSPNSYSWVRKDSGPDLEERKDCWRQEDSRKHLAVAYAPMLARCRGQRIVVRML